mgnify:CR=1 FL=1
MSTDMLERINEEIWRRTGVTRILPNEPSCLHLVQKLTAERHENRIGADCIIKLDHLKKEHKKEDLRRIDGGA